MSGLPRPQAPSSETPIDGVRRVPLVPHTDERGEFLEVFRLSWQLPIAPAQWSLVRSRARTLRGLHLHRRHDEFFVLLEGHAQVGLKDLRRDSPTFGRSNLLDLVPGAWGAVVFPPGILHGWYFPQPSMHLQAVSEEYATYQHDDNLACHWADPGLGIDWPDRQPVVSPAAARFGSLEALLARLAVD